MEKPGKKVCMKCGEEKPVAEFFVRKASKDGLSARCKSCVAKYARRYREESKEKIAAYKRRYCEENKEKVATRKRRYCEESKEKVATRKRRYCEENKEKIAAYMRRYREENKEKIAARGRGRRAAITDSYVRSLFRAPPDTPIPKPLIEAKRFHLRIVRELRKD